MFLNFMMEDSMRYLIEDSLTNYKVGGTALSPTTPQPCTSNPTQCFQPTTRPHQSPPTHCIHPSASNHTPPIPLHPYQNYIVDACASTVEILSASQVNVAQKPGARRLPLFQVDLVVAGEGKEAEFAYSTPEEAFLALPLKFFDQVLILTGNIVQVRVYQPNGQIPRVALTLTLTLTLTLP